MITETLLEHPVVSRDAWMAAATEFLKQEKAFTKERDAISRARRALPWTRIDKDYVFDSTEGPVTLSDLFGGRSQLLVYHFMYGPGWDEGCSGCSFVCDHADAARQHFEHHDVGYVAVSRAPLEDFQAFQRRMGWTFPWVSSNKNSFNYDFGVSFRREELDAGPVLYNYTMQKLNGEEQPGLSAFTKDENGQIYRTYSTYERGLDLLVGAYNYLDLAAKGRNEESAMSWMRLHDMYD